MVLPSALKVALNYSFKKHTIPPCENPTDATGEIQDSTVLFCDSRGSHRVMPWSCCLTLFLADYLSCWLVGWWFSSVRVTNGNFPFVWRIFTSHSFIHDLGLALSLLLAWLARVRLPTRLCVIFIFPQIQSVVVRCWWIGDCGEKTTRSNPNPSRS